MSLSDFHFKENDSKPEYITIKKTIFLGLIAIIVLLLLVGVVGSVITYSFMITPKKFCSYIVEYKVGDQDVQDGCYYKLAKEYSDVDFCNGVKNIELQKECVRVVSETIS